SALGEACSRSCLARGRFPAGCRHAARAASQPRAARYARAAHPRFLEGPWEGCSVARDCVPGTYLFQIRGNEKEKAVPLKTRFNDTSRRADGGRGDPVAVEAACPLEIWRVSSPQIPLFVTSRIWPSPVLRRLRFSARYAQPQNLFENLLQGL